MSVSLQFVTRFARSYDSVTLRALVHGVMASGVVAGLSLLVPEVGMAGTIDRSEGEPVSRVSPQVSRQVSPQAQILAQAGGSASAPAAVVQNLSAIDRAASAEDLETVLGFYDRTFLHEDGWTRADLRQSLTLFWERFSGLRYETELLSWDEVNGQIVTETRTQIGGTERLAQRTLSLESQLHLRQYWQGDRIVREEVLGERSQIQTGEVPPTLVVQLPEQVQVNESFNFDVIVTEPLGDDLLLGGVLDEAVRQESYGAITEIGLEPIVSGGIFKVGRAPGVEDTRWISAVVVRKGGMTFVTQRLQVVE